MQERTIHRLSTSSFHFPPPHTHCLAETKNQHWREINKHHRKTNGLRSSSKPNFDSCIKDPIPLTSIFYLFIFEKMKFWERENKVKLQGGATSTSLHVMVWRVKVHWSGFVFALSRQRWNLGRWYGLHIDQRPKQIMQNWNSYLNASTLTLLQSTQYLQYPFWHLPILSLLFSFTSS